MASRRDRAATARAPDRAVERRLVAGLLLVLTFAVFAEVRNHEYVNFDDRKHIINNPDVNAGLSLESVVKVFTRPEYGDFVPLTYVSLQLDRTLFGPDARGTLLVNVALHAASAVLLFLALAGATGAIGRSGFVAAVFAVHPLHVESVAWAFERKDVLSGFFWMLAVFLYLRRAASPRGVGSLLPVAACLIAGSLAKPMLVTLPFALILLDYWPLKRLSHGSRILPDPPAIGRAVLEKWLLFAIVAGIAIFTITRHASTKTLPDDFRVPLDVRLLYVPVSYVFYLWKSVWPTGLSVYYPYPYPPGSAPGPVWQAALALLGLVAVTALALRFARRAPYLLSGWAWYLGTLLPVIGIVQVGAHMYADRYSYIPQVGLAWMLAWGAVDAIGSRRAARRLVSAAAVAAVLALAVVAWHQVRHWRDTIALFERALAVDENDHTAHWRLARAYSEKGRMREAIERYRDTVRLQPEIASARFELAASLDDAGESEAAIPHFERALSLDPELTGANVRYGLLLVDRGRFEQALPLLERAIEADPTLPRAHAALAQAYAELARPRDARRHYREALRLDPGDLPTTNNFAMLLARTDDDEVRDPEEAIRLVEPFADGETPHPAVLDTLAMAHAAAGHLEQAIRIAERAVELARTQKNDPLRLEIEHNLERYRREHRDQREG